MPPQRQNASGEGGQPQPHVETAVAEVHHVKSAERLAAPDRFLSPLELDEPAGDVGPCGAPAGVRCSDKGFLAMSVLDYVALLDWTARQAAAGKRGVTPADAPPILERLGLSAAGWCELVRDFGRLFSTAAGHPRIVDGTRSRRKHGRFHLTRRVRELFPAGA